MNIHQKISAATLRPALVAISRRSLPQTAGRIYVEGLDSKASIRRDKWGIPYIQAATRKDLFFAQGFVHAQERLWQMEINRRAATGRLAAILGDAALDTDRLTRTLGFVRLAKIAWQNTSEDVRKDVKAYTNGINAYLRLKPPLPVEFKLIRHQPEPWQALDSVAFARLMAWSLSHVWAGKLLRAQLIEALGPELSAELDTSYPSDHPVTLPMGIEFNSLKADGMMAAPGPLLGQAMDSGSRGSNGWVLSGKRSATGSALLCNDMHLPITTPSLWYAMHLRGKEAGRDGQDIQVTGASMPGLPYILIGRNEHIAWGATVSFIDTEDLVVEKFDSKEPKLYEYQGEWLDAQLIEERIAVKGKPDHVEGIVVTRHGPLISNVLPTSGQALALYSVALMPVESFSGFAILNEARGWNDFVRAIQLIESPALNFLYSDVENNIGYYASGRVPIRTNGVSDVPIPGWTGESDWSGYIPFEEMPHALNPAQGYIVSANQRIIGDDYPHYLGASWRNGYRARRIVDLINEHRRISLEKCRDFQLDNVSIPGLELKRRLVSLETDDQDASICLNLMGKWDGRTDSESIGSTIYHVLLDKLARAILNPRMGQKLLESLLGSGPDSILYPVNEWHSQWPVILLRMLDDPNSAWLPAGDKREELLIQCMAETFVELRQLLGNDSEQWKWGCLHQIRFDHVFASQSPLDRIFNNGPLPIGGDPDTIAQTSLVHDNPGDNIAPSYRQIVDSGSFSTSLAMHAPGQSGHLASDHYTDLIQPWLTGQYYKMHWDEADVSEATVQGLRLKPRLRQK